MNSLGGNRNFFHYFFLGGKQNNSKSEIEGEQMDLMKEENGENRGREVRAEVKNETNLTL